MAALNKLNRAVESLKRIVSKPPEDTNKQKLKLTPCLTITELVCKSQEKSALLAITITSLIQILEEADSNTRLVIDESLNKIIKSSMNNSNHIAKILIALLKILGKNTNERCLKAALWRFAELAHYVRPHKGKIYVQTLLPVIRILARRKEESIHETLADSLPNIFKHIGLFTTDNDIKILLKAFFENLSSNSVEVRRAAAFSIIIICKYSRKPEYFFSHSLTTLLDILYDCQIFIQENRILIQGCLSCIRQILSHINCKIVQKMEMNYKNLEDLLQIYEFSLIYAKCGDHNVITAALETLNQLLVEAPLSFILKLISPGSFKKSTIYSTDDRGSTMSLVASSDILSIGSTIARTEIDIFSGNSTNRKVNLFLSNSKSCLDLNIEQKQRRTENWIEDQSNKSIEKLSSSSLLNMNTSHFANSDDEGTPKINDLTLSFRASSVDNIKIMDDEDKKLAFRETKQISESMKSISVCSTISPSESLNNLALDMDIGNITDEKDIPLNYCARFLVSNFLLDNQCENVKRVRVSVMSLALNCLVQLLKIYPVAGFISLEKDKDQSDLLTSILFQAKHEDQQIRGLVRIIIGQIIASSIMEDNYLLSENNCNFLSNKLLNDLIILLIQGLQDESSVCIKHSLHGVSICLETIFLTPEFKLGIPLLDAVFIVVDNPYWLIKIKILEMFEEISYELLYHVSDNKMTYQDKILKKIIIILLGDQDSRVRTAASHCLLKFISNAYYPIDHNYEPVAVTLAKKFNSKLKILYVSERDKKNKLQEASETLNNIVIERSLARIKYYLSQLLVKASSNYFIVGYCEALSVLANKYPPIKYSNSWECSHFEELNNDYSKYSPCELFHIVLSLMINTSLILNFNVHLHLLKLNSQLFIALCDSNLKLKRSYSSFNNECKWSFLVDEKLIRLSELFLRHLIRLTSVFNDVINDVNVKQSPAINLTSGSFLPLPIDQPLLSNQYSAVIDEDFKLLNKKNNVSEEKQPLFFQYHHDSFYVRLKTSLKSAYNNYEVTLKPESSEKFVSFLETVLHSFSIVLDHITVSEIDRVTKDLLGHLRTFMKILPVSSVHCVVQLLKCVFSTNAIAEFFRPYNNYTNENSNSFVEGGFYEECFQKPYDEIVNFTKGYSNVELREEDPGSPVIKLSRRNSNINILPSYIKLFEPNVIQSLREYTVTSDTVLQAEVLQLLSELIQLKMNYYLLDSEQVFIKFLLSQFQLIEEQQLLNVDKLLPGMFSFLIHLANEKHSKPIMSIPKVIQLCDSLIASVQSVSHCVLAMEPVVQYVFLKFSIIANNSEIKELETQRDVLFAMLLKLIHDPRCLRLLTLILNNSDEEQKVKRSSQIVKIFFSALVECKIPADENSTITIVDLLLALHSSSFNEKLIICTLFDVYDHNKQNDWSSWIPFSSALFLFIIMKFDESNILLAVKENLNHPVFKNVDNDEIFDPLFVFNSKEITNSPENLFIEFICKNIKLIFKYIDEAKLYDQLSYNITPQKMKQLSEFLLIFSLLVKSGKYKMLKKELNCEDYDDNNSNIWMFEISRLSYILLTTCPTIALRCYELMLCTKNENSDLHRYFNQFSGGFNTSRSLNMMYSCKRQSLSNDIIKLGVLLLAADRKDEFVCNNEIFKGFLESNLDIILNMLHELPIHNLLIYIQKSINASHLLIDVIHDMYDELINENDKMENVLECLEYTHKETQGRVLPLCCRFNLLNNSSLPISNRALFLSNEIINYLSTIKKREDFEKQFKENELMYILEELRQKKSFRFQKLINHLYDAASKWIEIPFSLSVNNFSFDFDRIRLVTVDKEWFINYVKKKCCSDEYEVDLCAESVLLSCLPFQDIFSIMCSQNFNNKILRYCILINTELNLHISDDNSCETYSEFSSSYMASRLAILRHIEHLKSLLPRMHQMYLPTNRDANKKEMQFYQRMDTIFSDKEFIDSVLCLIPAVDEFMTSVRILMSKINLNLIIPFELYQEFADFSVLCLEMVNWLIKNHRYWSRSSVMNSLKCCTSILKIKPVFDILSASQIGSIIFALYTVIENYTKETIIIPSNPIIEKLKHKEEFPLYHASHVMSTLIDYFVKKDPCRNSILSVSFINCIKELVMVLSGSTLVYNYLRIPLDIWKHISEKDILVGNCLTLNTIPEHFLQDSEILQNFVSRLMLIGWNNRLQFEEYWMLLLITFNSLPENAPSGEDVDALSQINAVSVSAITSLLVQTMYHPIPGYKASPTVFHVSRNNSYEIYGCRSKLKAVNDTLKAKMKIKNEKFSCLFDNVNVNIERLHNYNMYSFNQISVEYLALCCLNNFNIEENESSASHYEYLKKLFRDKETRLKNFGIDINSCVYFLIDFYSRWLLNSDGQSIYVLLEIVNSMLVISDLFTEPTQFTWLFESSILLWKKYAKNHDAICSYLIIIISKSASVCVPTDPESKKLVVKILKSGLNSKCALIQNASFHGLLYLLEIIFKKDILNQREAINDEFEDKILSASIYCVLENLDVDTIEILEKDSTYCLISIAFYLIENNTCGDNTDLLMDRLLKLSVRACKLMEEEIYTSIIQGFYNLILFENINLKKYDNEIRQLVTEIFSTEQCTTSVAILALQILTISMYATGDFEDTRNEESVEIFDSEKLIARIEKISIFLNRIRKCSKIEAELICCMLPQILNDFFPPSEVLNKIISEFLSIHHPYPELMADVVFKVFQNSIEQSQLTLIQDWVLSLLNNFRNYSLPRAVFCLTCFFVSACSNRWLAALFSSIKLRNEEIKQEDRKLLCIAAIHFYSQLTNESQKTIFISTFQSAQEIYPESPFSDILKCIL